MHVCKYIKYMKQKKKKEYLELLIALSGLVRICLTYAAMHVCSCYMKG